MPVEKASIQDLLAQIRSGKSTGGSAAGGESAQDLQSLIDEVNRTEGSGDTSGRADPFASGLKNRDEYNGRLDAPRGIPFILQTEQRMRYYGMQPDATGTIQPGTRGVWAHGKMQPAKREIFLAVNPTAVNVTQGLRAADSKTMAGTVQYVWRDSQRNTFFDEPKVTFHFQTGNINPHQFLQEGGTSMSNVPIPAGLSNFYEFLQLIDEDRITLDGRPNYVYVAACTRKFPIIVFVGFFDPEGITWDDNVDDPHQMAWQATMTCRRTEPELYNSAELKHAFRVMASSLSLPPQTIKGMMAGDWGPWWGRGRAA